MRGVRDVLEARGLRRALAFMVTPEAAAAHAGMLRSWHDEGVFIGIQPNVPGFRFPTYARDLGEYDEGTQQRIIAEATDDFAQALGFRPDSYVPCCGSKSPVTPRLLYEAGYRQMCSTAPGRYYADRPDRCTVGVFPYPHWGNTSHHLVAGDLPLCVIPNSGDLGGARNRPPSDLRAEAPVNAETHARFRRIVDLHVELSGLLGAPVRAIMGNTHNTEAVHLENVAYVADYVRQAAEAANLAFTPASMPDLHAALRRAAPAGSAGSQERQ
jgi:hypothetical protein